VIVIQPDPLDRDPLLRVVTAQTSRYRRDR